MFQASSFHGLSLELPGTPPARHSSAQVTTKASNWSQRLGKLALAVSNCIVEMVNQV